MKSIFILYLPGYAGNFLTRLFSLSLETVPHLPRDILISSVENKQLPVIDRLTQYKFSPALQKFNSWQKFHRSWPDFLDQVTFTKFAQLITPAPTAIIYSIHPHEFIKYSDKINLLDNTQFLYVDLDLSKYGQWLTDAQAKLKFVYRKQEVDQFEQLKPNMEKISLTAMLNSEEEFVAEYQRICKLINLQPELEQAITLYKDWAKTRKKFNPKNLT